MPRPLPETESASREQQERLEQQRIDATPVKIVGIDIPIGDIATIAIVFAVIWAVLGVIGYLVYNAVT